MSQHTQLYRPGKIGRMEVKNRIILADMGNALAILPEDVGRLEPGAEVTIQLLH